jgi:hypothetical protein
MRCGIAANLMTSKLRILLALPLIQGRDIVMHPETGQSLVSLYTFKGHVESTLETIPAYLKHPLGASPC